MRVIVGATGGVELLLYVCVVLLFLFGSGCTGVSWLGWCSLGLLGADLQVDFHQIMITVQGCSCDCVDVVDNIAPVFVDDGVIQLHHISIGTPVSVAVGG